MEGVGECGGEESVVCDYYCGWIRREALSFLEGFWGGERTSRPLE